MANLNRLPAVLALLFVGVLAAADRVQCQRSQWTSLSWNLSDKNLPLVKLPEVIHGDLNDLLVYPAPEFSLPIAQPLSFNAECDCYSLTLRLKTNQTLRVVQLWRTPGGFYRSANGPYLELQEFGPLKAITALGGTRYLFASAGETGLRCVSIHTISGNYLLIDYDAAGLISQLRDSFSRYIVPTYEGDRAVALKQTWIEQRTSRSLRTRIAP